MIGDCKKCPLPNLFANLSIYKEQAQMAQANVEASESPTQAEPYVKAKNEALEKLQETQSEYKDFVNTWRGTCGRCEFGA